MRFWVVRVDDDHNGDFGVHAEVEEIVDRDPSVFVGCRVYFMEAEARVAARRIMEANRKLQEELDRNFEPVHLKHKANWVKFALAEAA